MFVTLATFRIMNRIMKCSHMFNNMLLLALLVTSWAFVHEHKQMKSNFTTPLVKHLSIVVAGLCFYSFPSQKVTISEYKGSFG